MSEKKELRQEDLEKVSGGTNENSFPTFSDQIDVEQALEHNGPLYFVKVEKAYSLWVYGKIVKYEVKGKIVGGGFATIEIIDSNQNTSQFAPGQNKVMALDYCQIYKNKN